MEFFGYALLIGMGWLLAPFAVILLLVGFYVGIILVLSGLDFLDKSWRRWKRR